MLGLKYSYYVNEERFHGLNISPKKLEGYLVIASDFTITQDEMQILVDNDVAVLSTDHHDCQKTFIDCTGKAEGIVINNQYPFEPDEDRYLSGAGVFYELVCSLYPEFKSKEREALVGITLLSDVRQIENDKARKYLKTTYTSDTSEGYLNYLIENTTDTDFSFGAPRLDRNFIDFTLNPRINALLRFNRTEEAIQFVLGHGLKKDNYRESQRNLVAEMTAKANTLLLPSLDILAINALDFMQYNVKITSFIGLLCSDWKDKHEGKSVIGLVFENGKITRASFRGRYDDIHYRSGFKNLGIKAEGHPTAFGLIDFEPERETWVQLDDLVTDLESHHSTTVSIINSNNLAVTLTRDGMTLANENQYVRDMYRTYIKYLGNNIKINKITYKMSEFTDEDYRTGVIPDKVEGKVSYKYLRDTQGNAIPKYIEYMIDGRKVKSFGVTIEEGLILPMLEKGYIQLYVRPTIS